ncbi:zinc ribbon domain-containing protein [Candidatus Collierbacteria bacterium]|nr:zinc ribbon domain-containing protein [Candidatus Collierbacteria bacterium]
MFYKNPKGDDVVTDQVQLAQARAGADKTCPSCGQDNAAGAINCRACGGPMNEAISRPVLDQRLDEIPTGGTPIEPPPAINPSLVADLRPEYLRPTEFSSNPMGDLSEVFRAAGPWLLGGAVVVLLVIFGYFWFRTQDVPVTVSGFAWSRTVTIEEFKTITESGWSKPADARNVTTEQKVSGSHQEQDGTETYTYQQPHEVPDGEYKCGERDLGNGYSEDIMCPKTRTEYTTETGTRPKYKTVQDYSTWYTYQVDRWVFSRSVSSGVNDHNPYDPSYSLGGNERASGGTESYSVSFITKDEKKTYQMNLNYSQWAEMHIGQNFSGKVNSFGVLIAIETPK